MWESWEEFAEALEGRFGEEDQAAALQFAEESGLLDQWVADEDAEEAGSYDNALEAEFQRLESQLGRKLTSGEEQAMLNTISTQEQAEGVVPDFQAEFGDSLAGARNHPQGREHLGAEAAQAVFDKQAQPDDIPQPQFQAPTPEYDEGQEDHE